MRQSYVMQLVFDVDREEFGQSKSDASVEDATTEFSSVLCFKSISFMLIPLSFLRNQR